MKKNSTSKQTNEKKEVKRKRRISITKVPNILTVARILALIPFLLFAILGYWAKDIQSNNVIFVISNWIILAIFIIAMITDFVDGHIARKYKCVSSFGKLWDPLADKIITSSTLIYLAIINYVPFWIVILVIVRDLIVDGHRVVMGQHGIDVKASIYGKIKTIIISVGIIATMLVYNVLYTFAPRVVGFDFTFGKYLYAINSILIIGAILSILSGIEYVFALRRKLRVKLAQERNAQQIESKNTDSKK